MHASNPTLAEYCTNSILSNAVWCVKALGVPRNLTVLLTAFSHIKQGMSDELESHVMFLRAIFRFLERNRKQQHSKKENQLAKKVYYFPLSSTSLFFSSLMLSQFVFVLKIKIK